MLKVLKKKKFAISLQYLRMKLVFWLQIKIKVSSNWYYHFRCVWPNMPKLPKITSLLFLCNILRKKWAMKVVFCLYMHEGFLQIDTMTLMGIFKHPQSSKNSKFGMFLQYLKLTLIFWMQINTKLSCKLISALWASKFCTRWYCHYWWPWSSILKALKVMYKIFTISEKKKG